MERAAKLEPLTLLELTLHHSLIAVLSKPRWWVKWCDAEIRRKWLDEIQRELVQQTLVQSRKWEPSEDDILRALQGVVASESEDRDAQLVAWFARVRNDPWQQWPPDGEDDNDEDGDGEGEVDDDSNTSRDAGHKSVAAKSAQEEEDSEDSDDDGAYENDAYLDEKRMNPYVYVEWYFTRVVLRDKCVPPADSGETWNLGRLRDEIRIAETRSDPTVVPRALAFITSVLDGGATRASVRAALEGIETRAKTLAELTKHCKKIQHELANARSYVSAVLDQIAASEHMLLHVDSVDQEASGDVGDSERAIATPTGVHGAWICDRLVPECIKAALVQQVAALENVPEHAKDWHPNTNQQVLDLVHPSLFCCVFGLTKRVASPVDDIASFKDAAEHMRSITGGTATLVTSAFHRSSSVARARGNSSFQWIPSEFQVAANGSVRILSYINNVHPERHRALYGAIEAIFARFVPLFERTLSALTVAFPRPVFDAPEDYNGERPQFPETVEIPFDAGTSVVSLKGKRVQVIVKVAEIVLTPEAPTYSGGAWHIEGTETEQIVATGIYYFGCENVRDSRLSFRVSVHEPMYDQSDDSGVAVMFGLFNEDLLVQTLGSVPTIEDRCLVFPNVAQHKVEPFELADRTRPGVRKILAFFLVDPEKAIPSTAVIPPQQRDWVEEIQRPLLERTKLFDSVQAIIKEMASGDCMTLEQAKEHRLVLMSERSALSQPNPDDYESYFSLCEH